MSDQVCLEFCNVCSNMLYMNIRDSDLISYCKNCGFEKTHDSKESIMISSLDYQEHNKTAGYVMDLIDKNIRYDTTLPHVMNIVCVNPKCTKDKKKENDVIYINYDKQNLKYAYICTYCDHFWKNDLNKSI